MSLAEIVIDIPRAHAEALSDALMDAGALSVSVEDADLGTAAEKPLFGEPGMLPETNAWEHSRIVALTETNADHVSILTAAATSIGLDQLPKHILRPVADQDWVRLTQSQFEPIQIGKNIWVVPSWHDAPDPNGLILELDPGLAFGTGSHPTTRLCMEWLEAHAPLQQSVLDYGCGSGILALVAKKLGAAKVVGVDIDPQAIEAAQHNALRNQCEIAYYLPEAYTATQTATTSLPSYVGFNIVVANILSGPLTQMAAMLAAQITSKGTLVLSGILSEQAQDVIQAYAPFIPLRIWAEQDGWVALSGQLSN